MAQCNEVQAESNSAKDEEDHLTKNGAVDNMKNKG